MTSPEQFVTEARSYVNTPFHHGGRLPGVGLDCIGVAVCAAAACGLQHRDLAAYPLRANGQLAKELDAQLACISHVSGSIPGALPGDILLMAFEPEPHHIAIYASDTIIHAYTQARKCVEQPFVYYWRGLVRGVYRFKEFANG